MKQTLWKKVRRRNQMGFFLFNFLFKEKQTSNKRSACDDDDQVDRQSPTKKRKQSSLLTKGLPVKRYFFA